MAGNTTPISLCSNALLLLGGSTISAFTDGSTGATIASNLYDSSYRSLLTTFPWSFARKKTKLTRLESTPLDEYQYMFQLPLDFLSLIKATTREYRIYGDKLYVNSKEVSIEYTASVKEDTLPHYFIKPLEFFLASQFALSLTGSMDKGKYYNAFFVQEIAKAKYVDSAQTPADSFIDGNSRYLDVRY